MEKLYVKIDGIQCSHCEDRIKNRLLRDDSIDDVIINNNIATISYQKGLTSDHIIELITDLGYVTKKNYISDKIEDIS